MEFVFAEYPQYVGTQYNDVFGVFLNDTDFAFDSTGAPITINRPFFSGKNVDNNSGTVYGGATPLLRSTVPSRPLQGTIISISRSVTLATGNTTA